MICDHCRTAGQKLKDDEPAEAESLHRQCADINCTCQHRTDPNLINYERLPSRDNDKADAAEGHQSN
jgi:hypothetical protein